MPPLPFYQVDAFASHAFEGNQACVMPLGDFLPDDVLQAIAAENNVAETAFIVRAGDGVWRLRWFTPTVEVPLCGHATLASAHVLFTHEKFSGDRIVFETVSSGRLTVRRLNDGRLEMDFPSSPIDDLTVSDDIAAALGARPVKTWIGMFIAAQFDTPEDIRALAPDFKRLARIGGSRDGSQPGNVGCFALGGTVESDDGVHDVDVTSRFFAPGSGIDEDPATGAWHTMLARIMAERFGTAEIDAYQAYPGRGARIGARLDGERVKLIGRAVTTITGSFHL